MPFPPVAALPWLVPFIPLIRLALRGRHPALADAPPSAGTLVSVVIPARNESANIETVLRSVLGSRYAPLEVIVVDDRSTDDTALIVERVAGTDARVHLLRGVDLPPGWFGKSWACVQGFRAAQGALILFT
ncbi:MAG: glycosyltransferase family 2 protein, partial [Gemmatimonadales bacterium]